MVCFNIKHIKVSKHKKIAKKNILLALFLISLLSCEDDDPILDAYKLVLKPVMA
jgi:hypothetical protein